MPTGWYRVPLARLPGADVPMEIASFPVRGAVRLICRPNNIMRQVPPGGALVQLLATGDASYQPPLRRPFHLGRLQSYECGEAYNVFFREGGRAFQLRIWAAPTGLSPAVRRQIEAIVDSLQVRNGRRISLRERLR